NRMAVRFEAQSLFSHKSLFVQIQGVLEEIRRVKSGAVLNTTSSRQRSSTPHPTELRSATFSHNKGRREGQTTEG
ncbi:hypothetical protein, partial [Mesorhizobium sp.]|uniref:hypothetical protein n=1 Tax=Mesorhizobium sp. TaxID=1871066 RepID=UPI0025F378B8